MTEKLRKLFQRLYTQKALFRFRPLVTAADEFFFGTDKVTIISARSPHILDHLDIKRYMMIVIIALLPSLISAVYFYRLRVLLIIACSYIFGGMAEVLFAIIRKKEIYEGFLVTGLLFPLLLPPTVPLWVVAIGIVFGVVFAKEVFGGTSRNIFNPAMVGRLFITVCFPTLMTTRWQVPFTDAITSATPLITYKTSQAITPLFPLLLGNTPGSIGETFRLGIILGGIFIIYTKVANWRIPFAYLFSVFIFSFIGNNLWPDKFAPPVFQIFSGGLLFGVFFMATDPVTTPFTRTGRWIFGLLAGLLTILIRGISGYVEGVMFSIVLMNGFSPLIDQLVLSIKYRPRRR